MNREKAVVQNVFYDLEEAARFAGHQGGEIIHQSNGDVDGGPAYPDCNADLDNTSLEEAAASVLGTIMMWYEGVHSWIPLSGCLTRLSASGKGCHVSWPSWENTTVRVCERAAMADDPLRIMLDLQRKQWESEILWDKKKNDYAGPWIQAGKVL